MLKIYIYSIKGARIVSGKKKNIKTPLLLLSLRSSVPELGTKTKYIFLIISHNITGDFGSFMNSLKMYEEYYIYMCLGQGRRRRVLSFHQISQEVCDLFARGLKQIF